MHYPVQNILLASALLLAVTPAFAVEVDPGFRVNFRGTVHAVAVTPSGEVLVGGDFDQVNGVASAASVKLARDGSFVSDLAVPNDGPVLALAFTGDGCALAGGFPGGAVLVNSSKSSSINLGLPGRAVCLSATAGSLLAGGSFRSEGESFLTRFNADGTRDTSFNSALLPSRSMEAGVSAVAIQKDGKIWVGGNFELPSGSATLARLNPDGTVDSTFDGSSGAILYVSAIHVLTSGKILVAGTADATGRGFVRRLLLDGSVDPEFHEPVVDQPVQAVAQDNHGRILCGGWFSQVNGEPHARLARLNADGTLDALWALGANNVVTTIAVSEDQILVGGAFTEMGGIAQRGLVRVRESDDLHFRALSLEAGGAVQITLKGDSGRTYVIETSSDLNHWNALETHTATEAGLVLSQCLGEASRQFFRARLVE